MEVESINTTEKFEKAFNYSRSFQKILIANNGIAAVKCIRSIRQWCYNVYENERIVYFIAMVTPEDLNGNAEYVQLADEFISIPTGPSSLNYGNVDLIVNIAQQLNVDGVWAGWGHASENPLLPKRLAELKIIFMGPSSTSMWLLGDKIASNLIAQTLGIPTLPWSGSGIVLESDSTNIFNDIPPDLYTKCEITSHLQISKFGSKMGFPLMLKASNGGGGKGIRRIDSNSDFERLFKQVSQEVPNSPIFLSKVLENARHIEVQLLGDYYGDVISIFTRDCSIQRRHQKIIEEAPAIICPNDILRKMEADAVKMAKSVNYYSAGTVEYLYDLTANKYYFLELNPRLQVEHPCTEIIANINLPACQLQIAIGRAIGEIKEIKHIVEYMNKVNSSTNIDGCDIGIYKGHVIAARITAENPEEGFLPYSGSLRQLNFRSSRNICGYFSVNAEGSLHKHADSQFGHLFSWGESRDDARKGMAMALKELSVHGEIRTTIDFLIGVLEHPLFISNKTHTEWLDNIKNDKILFKKPCIRVIIACGGVCIAADKFSKLIKDCEISIERGQVPKYKALIDPLKIEFIYERYKYSLTASMSSPNSLFITINGSIIQIDVYNIGINGYLISLDKRTYSCYFIEDLTYYSLDIGSASFRLYKDVDHSILRSPSSGKLVSYLVEDGAHVLKGTDFAEIEVMKMVMTLPTPESGIIHHVKEVSSIIESGTILARLIVDDPQKITSAEPFIAPLEYPTKKISKIYSDASCNSSQSSCHSPSGELLATRKAYIAAYDNLLNIMNGYGVHEPFVGQYLNDNLVIITNYMAKPSFCISELQDVLLSLKNCLSKELYESISILVSNYAANLTSVINQIPIDQIMNLIHSHAKSIQSIHEKESFYLNIFKLTDALDKHRKGIRYYKMSFLLEFLKNYLQIESNFPDTNIDYWISTLIYNNLSSASLKSASSDLFSFTDILKLILSHSKVQIKNNLASRIIDLLSEFTKNLNLSNEEVKNIMTRLSNLPSNDNLKLALKAKQFLLSSFKPSFQLRHNQMESLFLSIIGSENSDTSIKRLTEIIHSDGSIFDIIPNFFFSSNLQIQTIALEIYIRRTYHCYKINHIFHQKLNHIPIIRYSFTSPVKSKHNISNTNGSEIFKEVTGQLNNLIDQNSNSCSCFGIKKRTEPIQGIMGSFDSFEELNQHFSPFMSFLSSEFDSKDDVNTIFAKLSDEPVIHSEYNSNDTPKVCNVVTICVQMLNLGEYLEDALSEMCQNFVNQFCDVLISYSVRRLTFLLSSQQGEQPFYFTFKKRLGYKEDKLFRHIEPSVGFLLELKKMANFDLEYISCENPSIQIYYGVHNMKIDNITVPDYRYFIRTIIRNVELISVKASFEYVVKASEIKLLEALDQLDVITAKTNKKGSSNHIFFNFTPCILIDPQKTIDCIRDIIITHSGRLLRHKIMHAELKMEVLLEENSSPVPLRLVVFNDSGYSLNMSLYKEVLDENSGNYILQPFLGDKKSLLAGLPSNTPYPVQDRIQIKRNMANLQKTTYVYDYKVLFYRSLSSMWKEHYIMNKDLKLPSKDEYVQVEELVLENPDSLNLIPIERPAGFNDVGVVCWKYIFKMPDDSQKLEAIVVINDVTILTGSFTEAEAKVFKAAGMLAREKKIPFIYICCSSGARIGLAEEVRNVFKVAWKNENDYSKGIDYLYVTKEDYDSLISTSSILAEKISYNNETRYKLTDIYGKINGIGVENLRGSGLIAGEMSKCFQETFTISLVTGKAVGIGAYLVRLGRRVIQVDGSTIILTGFEALNKVLGRNVYSSHTQLGGVDIMHSNGVSQLVAKDDFDGIRLLLQWLSYSSDFIHKKRLIETPINTQESLQLKVDEKLITDPRILLFGTKESSTYFITGFFDPFSCFEINKGWAKSIISGRARLGKIPVAYIINEVNFVKHTVPADPADAEDVAKDVVSITQVLSPESSYKFSQTIDEANSEKLPLFIFANLRGFSAGLKDMYNQVLKYGAMIVDSLRNYSNPVFIYILPKGEVRGGAWAVLDTFINPEHIEMYCCDDSRANILEPAGTVSVKFRDHDINKLIARLEPNYTLNDKNKPDDVGKNNKINDSLKKTYLEVAIRFADLHDTPNRMLHKKVVRGIIKWKESRKFFYWRLKRRIYELKVLKILSKADPRISGIEFEIIIKNWFIEANFSISEYLNDEIVVSWFEKNILIDDKSSPLTKTANSLSSNYLIFNILQEMHKNPDLTKETILNLFKELDVNIRADILNSLNDVKDKNIYS